MKILIVSHCQMSTFYSIGKTLMSLFGTFEKSELCQLYVHGGNPNADLCNSYYQITDKAVLKGIFKRRVAGKETFYNADEIRPAAFSQKQKNESGALKEMLRDLVWSLSPWYNKSLRAWLDREKPTCIFVAIGSGKFLYDMAMRISEDYSIPIVTYVCDDFCFNKAKKSLVEKIWQKKIISKSKKLFSKSKALVSICREMSELYEQSFHVPAYTIMTGSYFEIPEKCEVAKPIKTIQYFGKLSLNRYQSIIEIGKAIDEIDKRTGEKHILNVYSGEVSEEVKKLCKEIRSIRLHGFISGEEFQKAFLSSDALLHIESFDSKTVERVKYSVSTKIADSLASGIPLFAYGPGGIASIEHLRRNDCAVIATDPAELSERLSELFTDTEKVQRISKNAIETAKKYHVANRVSRELYDILQSVSNGAPQI